MNVPAIEKSLMDVLTSGFKLKGLLHKREYVLAKSAYNDPADIFNLYELVDGERVYVCSCKLYSGGVELYSLQSGILFERIVLFEEIIPL